MAKKQTGSSPDKTPPKPPAVASLVAAAVHEWPKLEIFSQGQIAKARKTIGDQYGNTFASKASDRLCQALATVQLFAMETVASRPRPTILEFTQPAIDPAEVLNRAVTLGAKREAVPPMLLRLARRHTMRDRFSTQVAGIMTTLEGRSRPLFPAGLEAIASPTTPSSVVEICWLSGAIRTFVDARGLRDIAEERTLSRLDLPRPLRADIDGTGPRVGATQFRTRFTVTGEHITVAIIDTEVDIKHPALAGRVVLKANYTKERWGAPNAHGTAVAGIIGSSDAKFTGMAPGVTLLNYKVLATDTSLNGDDFSGAVAIQQALEDGAQIANCSWGAGPAGDGTSREAVACNNAWSLGLIIVKSAGNNGPDASSLTSPADADGVIVVGATDRAGTAVQDYSSRGPSGTKQRPHLVAPGGTEFDPMHSCLVAGGFGNAEYGTSFAAPHVSGLAALLLARTPGLSADDLRTQLLGLCTPLAAGDANTQGQGFVSLASVK